MIAVLVVSSRLVRKASAACNEAQRRPRQRVAKGVDRVIVCFSSV